VKSARIGFLILPTVFLLFVCHALAFESNSTWLTLGSPAVVKGNLLQPGEYMLKWKPGSPECGATFYRRGKPVVEVRTRLVERDTKARETAISTITGPDGRSVIKEIRVGGTTTVLVME